MRSRERRRRGNKRSKGKRAGEKAGGRWEEKEGESEEEEEETEDLKTLYEKSFRNRMTEILEWEAVMAKKHIGTYIHMYVCIWCLELEQYRNYPKLTIQNTFKTNLRTPFL